MSVASDKLFREQTLFELFKSESYSDTINSLLLAEAELERKILSITDDTWTKRKLTDIKKSIDSLINSAYSDTLPSLSIEIGNIANVVSKSNLGNFYTEVPKSTLDLITSKSFEVQGLTVEEIFKTLSENHARQLRVIVASGVVKGETSKTIARNILDKSSSLSRGQLKTAVFTTISEARAKTRNNSYKSLQDQGIIKGYEYVATLDSRTSEYCRNHDGRKYYKPIEEIQGEINVHYNCRSVFVPLTSTSTSNKRASMFGQVQDEPYYKWFSKQDDSFQKLVLGKKYNSYKNGSYKIGGLPDILGVALSLSEIETALTTMPIMTKEEFSQMTAEDQKLFLDMYGESSIQS